MSLQSNYLDAHRLPRALAHAYSSSILVLAAACGAPESHATPCALPTASGERVLIFTRTTGYRHESIPIAVAAVESLAATHGFAVEHTESLAFFADDTLKRFAAVMFLHTTGDILNDAQQSALQRFVAGNRGFIGVHSAADTEYDWPWYAGLVGAYFKSHPTIQQAKANVRDTTHLSTRCLSTEWTRSDEWYDFRRLPTSSATVLATLDESSYTGGAMGANHPIAWYQHVHGGRSWYTGMGHTSESWSEPAFRNHIAGGILWALGR